MKSNYNIHTLSSGLRIIQLPSPSKIIYCGYQIAAGTRHEPTGKEGLAHFCEHVTFKGTERRSALQVINTLESVGGELNAFTNKEATVYYSCVLKEHFFRAVDLLTDIVLHSTYPEAELEKEKEVVCDEIESYNDSPAELIYDEFENLLFQNHPLGHNILGSADTVRSFTSDDVKAFTQEFYRPDNMIFFVYGDVDMKRLLRWLEAQPQAPQPPKGEQNTVSLPPYGGGSGWGSSGGLLVRDINSHQAHVMIGTRAYDVHHPLRIALYLLNNILGGPGMNTRFNLALREKRGLVYTVESTMVTYGDTGMWNTYFGCDHKDINRCLRLVRRELDRFINTPLSARQLSQAKRQIKGQIALATDNRENFAIDFGKSFLHWGWEKNIDRLYESIDRVTAEDIQQVARELFAEERLTVMIYK